MGGEPGAPVPSPANFEAADPGSGKMPRGKPMPLGVRYLLGGYVMGMLVFILYFLVKLWPLDSSKTVEMTEFFWGTMPVPTEIRLMLIAALAGALGAYVHLATSFADYAGNNELTASWGWWYLLRPFIGVALAEIVYLSLRGGLLNAVGNNSASAVSPYGVAAVTALTGLFSRQGTDKLREVFETLFRTEQKVQRSDPLPTTTNAPPAPSGADSQALEKKSAAAAAGPQS